MRLLRLFVGILLLVPLQAGPGRSAEVDEVLAGLSPKQQDVALFVLGNTVFAAYHVAAEALIDDLDLPVQPAAASILATILMLPDEPDPLRDEMLLAAIDGWQLALDYQAERRELAGFWRRPGFDARRYAEAVCLIIGSDPAGFAEYARDRGMAEGRIESCSQSFDGAEAGWLRLLEPHLVPEDSEGTGLHGIRLRFARTLGFADITEFLVRTGVVADAMTTLASTLRLKRDLRLNFSSCGVPQTRWLPERGQMTVCYELVRTMETMITDALANR